MAGSTPALDPRFTTRARRPGVDFLRAAAIVLVVCYHAGNFGLTLPHDAQRFGWIGVDLFFVLSGYLIGGQWLAPLASGGRLELRRFFWRRALRILPAYLVVLAVYVAFPSWREWPHLPPTWKYLCFVQNIDLHGGTAFSHAWSLCVEAQFYLVLPFLLLLLVRWRNAGIVTAVGVLLAGLVLRAALACAYPAADGHGVSGRAFQSLVYYPTWTRLDPLVLGFVHGFHHREERVIADFTRGDTLRCRAMEGTRKQPKAVLEGHAIIFIVLLHRRDGPGNHQAGFDLH